MSSKRWPSFSRIDFVFLLALTGSPSLAFAGSPSMAFAGSSSLHVVSDTSTGCRSSMAAMLRARCHVRSERQRGQMCHVRRKEFPY